VSRFVTINAGRIAGTVPFPYRYLLDAASGREGNFVGSPLICIFQVRAF
jgi:hypothetical protein